MPAKNDARDDARQTTDEPTTDGTEVVA